MSSQPPKEQHKFADIISREQGRFSGIIRILTDESPGAGTFTESEGEWPILISQFSFPTGELKRTPNDYFDLFIPMRPTTLIEVSGNRRSQFKYRTGMVGFDPPGAEWAIKWDGAIEGVSIFIDRPTMAKALQHILGENIDDLSWRLALGDHAPAIAYLGLDIVRQILEGKPCGQEHIDLQIKTFLAMLIRRYSSTTTRDNAIVGITSRHVQRTVQYINAHLFSDLTLEDICEMNAVSLTHMNRLFREELGTSVWNYVQKRRLESASTRLASGNESIENIAQSCGFHTRAHFTRLFKAIYGETPSSYREKRQIEP